MNTLQNTAVNLCFAQRKSYPIPDRQESLLAYHTQKRDTIATHNHTPPLSEKELYCCQLATD